MLKKMVVAGASCGVLMGASPALAVGEYDHSSHQGSGISSELDMSSVGRTDTENEAVAPLSCLLIPVQPNLDDRTQDCYAGNVENE